MRAWIVAIALVLCAGSAPAAGPEVAVVVPGTGTEIGRIARADGSFPFGIDATADRTACMMDPRSVALPQLKALVREATRDRVEAYRAMVRLTDACMRAKGWRFTPCGTGDAPDCAPPIPPGPIPGSTAEGEPGDR